MKVKFKKLHEDAVIPTKTNPEDSGFDVVAIDDGKITDTYIEYNIGIAVEPPPGYDIKIFPRSSVSKYNLILANSIGLVDNPYRGPITLRFKQAWGPNKELRIYKKGDKIGQLVIQKVESDFEFEEVDELNETKRGENGYGSSGN